MNLSLNNKITNLEIIVNETQVSPITYLFKASSSLFTNRTYSPNQILEFDTIKFCYTVQSAYNTNTFRYVIPKNGIYQFSYNVFLNTTPGTSGSRIAIYKNDVAVSIAGSYAGNIESLTTYEECVLNDIISIRHHLGPNITLFMGLDQCSFCGALLKEL